MTRFVLPKTTPARRWVRSTDTLRAHLQQRLETLRERATAKRREGEEIEAESVQLEHALELLNQLLPPKSKPTTAGALTVAQPAALESGRWAPNHDACTKCGRSTVKHVARGLCATCYTNERRGLLAELPEPNGVGQ